MDIDNKKIKIDLFKFFKDVIFKNRYKKILLSNSTNFKAVKEDFNSLGSYKIVKSDKKLPANYYQDDSRIMYIVDIQYTKSNTLLHVSSFDGDIKFFCSAGQFNFKGKQKVSRFIVLKHFFRLLTSKLSYLKNKPVALHLKNVGFRKAWIVKFFKKKFFLKTVKVFNMYPHNGCRKPKVRRKKIRLKRK